jgi:RNA polymerase sigma-70 factor (ECF subfamily)
MDAMTATLAELANPEGGTVADESARLRALVIHQLPFVVRTLRALGVPEGDVDDAAQEVFLAASRKLRTISHDREPGFLFRAAMNEALHVHRSRVRRREAGDALLAEIRDPVDLERLSDQRRARETLDAVLGTLPLELRAVFVLFEIEEMDTAQIASLLDLPLGTVASRLRRAREQFQQEVRRLRARMDFKEGRRHE